MDGCCKVCCSLAANGFFNFLGGGRLTGVQALLFGSILSSSAGFVGVLDTGDGSGNLDWDTGLREEKGVDDEGLLAVIAVNAGRAVDRVGGGRVEAGGGGSTAGAGLVFSSGHAFARAELAFPYSDPAEAIGAPKVGLEEVETGGLEVGGGAFFKAAISTFPTGV